MLRSIAFGGGGLRGILHAGVYRSLLEQNPGLNFPDGIYGCSVGCIAALAAAFRLTLPQVERLCFEYMFIDKIVDRITIDDVQSLFEKRGLTTTDKYLSTVAEAFDAYGINLRTMTMSDLPQPVTFVSSNMTTGRASLLRGKIPVLKALACSSCLPFCFVPEVLNGHVHLDGAVFARSLREVLPSETLIVYITRTDWTITPTQGTMWEILLAMSRGSKTLYTGPNILQIDNRTFSAADELSDDRKRAVMDDAYLQARAFFAKRLTQELK